MNRPLNVRDESRVQQTDAMGMILVTRGCITMDDSRLQELEGETVFPPHIDLSLFEPLENFVSVGVGPLVLM